MAKSFTNNFSEMVLPISFFLLYSFMGLIQDCLLALDTLDAL